MSVVVAIKHKGIIYMGADSQVTKGGSRMTLKNPSNYKIWHINQKNNLLMGAVGRVRENNIIKTSSKIIDELNILKNNIDYQYIVRHAVENMFNELDQFGALTKDSEGIKQFNSNFLLACNDKLFMISSDGAALEIDDYAAIGSGASEALGNLQATQKEAPEKRIELAIKSSATNDIYVDYPIIIGNTENSNYQVIYKRVEDDNV